MNLYKSKPEIPKSYPLPEPIPMPRWDTEDRLRLVIYILIGLLVVICVYSFFDEPMAVTCDCPDMNIQCVKNGGVVRNNIQATHTYTDFIGQKGIQMCFVVDDYGDLYGSSMQPTFFEGNTVLMKNYTMNMTIKTGDMLRFYRKPCSNLSENLNNSLGGMFINDTMAVIHRVNAVYDDYILMSGDNLDELESIQRCQVTHKVIGIIYT